MTKVIKGTKDQKRFEVIRGQKDTRAIRCTNKTCGQVAVQVPDGKGGSTYRCPKGHTFKFVQM